MSMAATRDTLLRLLAPVATQNGLDLEDVEVTPAGRRRLVRVVVDRDGGASLDDLAAVSQSMSTLLDEDASADAALGGAPYVLEVTSPGVDRPLTQPRHWRRATGRLVVAGLPGGEEVIGRVVTATEDTVTLATDGGDHRALSLAEIARARVQVEFSRHEGV